jgi:hypothetical protein
MKRYVFSIRDGEEYTWEGDLRQQLMGFDNVIIIDQSFAGLTRPGLVETDNSEVEMILRLKFPDIRCYNTGPGQRVI